MIKFYTSHCPQCKIAKTIMDKKHIEYNEIDDENIYIPIAEKHNIASLPFGEINGKVVTNKELMKYKTIS